MEQPVEVAKNVKPRKLNQTKEKIPPVKLEN